MTPTTADPGRAERADGPEPLVTFDDVVVPAAGSIQLEPPPADA
jgi:hypothetical protein